MSTGHLLIWLGAGLLAAGGLLLILGELLAQRAKKSALRSIRKDYL